jgi:hypothetical protein
VTFVRQNYIFTCKALVFKKTLDNLRGSKILELESLSLRKIVYNTCYHCAFFEQVRNIAFTTVHPFLVSVEGEEWRPVLPGRYKKYFF